MKKNGWKKFFAFAVVVCLLFGMTSCGKTEPLTLGEKVVVDKHVEFTPENVLVSSKVFPPISGSNPMGWICDDEKRTYVTVTATVKNLGDEPITIDELWQNFCISMGEELIDGSIIAITTNNETKLSDSEVIEGGKTENVYYITEMDKDDLDDEKSAEFDFGKTTLVLSLDTSKRVAQAKPLKLKETYKVKNLGKVMPKKMGFTQELEPANPGYTYDYYAPQTGDDKLLVLTTETKNTTKKKKSAYRYLNMMVFVGDDVYLGDVVADDAYAANITGSEKLSAGDERNVYALVNLPKSVKKKDCEIYVYIDGKYYRYEMK